MRSSEAAAPITADSVHPWNLDSNLPQPVPHKLTTNLCKRIPL